MRAIIDKAVSDDCRLAWAQVDATTGEVAGTTSFYQIDTTHRILSIGHTWIGKRWQRVEQVPGVAGVWPRVALLSVAAATGHLMVFVVAARTAEVTAPLTELVPLGLVVLVAAAIPLSLAGWGRAKAPRRGSSPRSASAARPVLRSPSPTASSRWSPRFPALPY